MSGLGIGPTQTDVARFTDKNVTMITHCIGSDGNQNNQINGFRQTAGSETDIYWVAYVLSAFQGAADADYDPDGESATLGFTPGPVVTDVGSQISLIYLETIRDVLVHPPAGAERMSESALQARVTVHEVGQSSPSSSRGTFHALYGRRSCRTRSRC